MTIQPRPVRHVSEASWRNSRLKGELMAIGSFSGFRRKYRDRRAEKIKEGAQVEARDMVRKQALCPIAGRTRQSRREAAIDGNRISEG